MVAVLCALNARYMHTNLAVRCLKANCSGLDVRIEEHTINDPIGKVERSLLSHGADVYAFSCYIWNIDMALRLAETVKKARPGCIVLLGGPEVSFDENWDRFKYADYVIKGEGETAFSSFLKATRQGEDVHGIVGLYWEGGGNEPTALQMEKLAFPYELPLADRDRIYYYEASRGCPFGCAYCLSAGEGVRRLPVERVKSEIDQLAREGIRQIKFVDRTFNEDLTRAKEIFKHIISLETNTNFHFEMAGDMLDDEAIDILGAAPKGRIQLEIGVQTTNEKALNAISRRQDWDKLSKTVTYLRKKGNVHLHLDLIAGLPGEDLSSFKKSFNTVYSLRPHMLQLGFLKLLYGSGLRDEAEDIGILYRSYAPYEVLSTREMSAEDLLLLKIAEEGIDLYNSGKFSNSFSYITTKIDPFNFYFELGNDMFRHKGQLNLLEKSKSVYNTGLKMGADPKILTELLRFDYLLTGKAYSFPDWMGHVLDDEAQRLIKEHRSYGKQAHIERFAFDIFEYTEKGIVDNRPTYIRFTYGGETKAERIE